MRKVLFLLISFSIVLFANDTKSVAKILVVDKAAFEKIESVNILNGGLQKRFVISSSRISQNDLKEFYPEYFLYKGLNCQLINKVEVINQEYKESHDASPIRSKAQVKREIEKIKMVQALVDIGYKNLNTLDLNRDSIKAFGILCNNQIIIREKAYKEKDFIGNLKIRRIDSKDNSIYLEVK
jgi:hypothetical protein